jgi:hypothetical protein
MGLTIGRKKEYPDASSNLPTEYNSGRGNVLDNTGAAWPNTSDRASTHRRRCFFTCSSAGG